MGRGSQDSYTFAHTARSQVSLPEANVPGFESVGEGSVFLQLVVEMVGFLGRTTLSCQNRNCSRSALAVRQTASQHQVGIIGDALVESVQVREARTSAARVLTGPLPGSYETLT